MGGTDSSGRERLLTRVMDQRGRTLGERRKRACKVEGRLFSAAQENRWRVTVRSPYHRDNEENYSDVGGQGSFASLKN